MIDILYETSIIVIDNNNVYVSWTDGTPGNWGILLTTSINGGETFDKPKTLVTILVNHGNQTCFIAIVYNYFLNIATSHLLILYSK